MLSDTDSGSTRTSLLAAARFFWLIVVGFGFQVGLQSYPIEKTSCGSADFVIAA